MNFGNPRVTVGIPTYAGACRAEYLIRSLYLHKYEGEFEILLLDDGSPDGGRATEKLALKYKTSFIRFPENRGIPAAWNALVNHFQSPYTILFNDDVIVMKDWYKSMIGFLEVNHNVGSASYPQYFCSEEDSERIVTIGTMHDEMRVTPRDPISKIHKPESWRHSWGARAGRIMCPAGSAFGFTIDKFHLVEKWNKEHGLTGAFPEEYKSFHEESEFGSVLAMNGYQTFGLTYPQVWHTWSATFRASPELNAHHRMVTSRGMYCETFKVPPEFWNNPFEYTHPKYSHGIPEMQVTWMMPDGSWKTEASLPCSCAGCVNERNRVSSQHGG